MSTIVSESPRYVTASTTPPAITCPDWCVVPQEDHLSRLFDLEGMVSHDSANESGLYYSVETYADGTPVEKSPLIYTDGLSRLDCVDVNLDGVTPDEAEHVALQILAAVKAARA